MRRTKIVSFALAACVATSLFTTGPVLKASAEADTSVEAIATGTDAEGLNEKQAIAHDWSDQDADGFVWEGTVLQYYVGKGGDVKIPDKCTVIGDTAFSGREDITSIEIPEGVTTIGENAFVGCSGLTSITIPDSITTIRNSAFNRCSNLTSVRLSKSITKLGKEVFLCCSKLVKVEIPENVTEIGENTFGSCESLTSITLPNGLKAIGSGAFGGCSELDNVVIPEDVETIGRAAFESCINLTNITIPGSVKTIEYQTFSGCTKLTNVEIKQGVTSIGKDVFANCISLTNVMLPSSLITIENHAFGNCVALKNIVIPEGVQKIALYAFSSCSGLKEIEIPKSVTEMGYAFPYCDSLTRIVVDKDNPVYDSRNNCNAVIDKKTNMLVVGCKSTVIPESVKIIGDGAFIGLAELTSVAIPYGVEEIRSCAFWRSGITSVTLPESVTVIRRQAFSECNNLANLTIPQSVKVIEYDAFACCAFSEIIIPNGVESIEDWTFMGCTNLKNVSIPDSVTSIGREVFWGCKSLESITIPKSVTTIAYNAFTDLKTIRGYAGSYAETYAKKNGYKFEDMTVVTVPTVTNVQAAAAGKNKVKVTWDKVSGATGYIVYARKNGTYAKLGVTAATSYTDTKALDNDYNFYFVYAYKKTAAGNIFTGKCQKYAYAKGTGMAVTNLKASSVKGGVKLTWTKSAGADGYIVYGKKTNFKYGYVGMTTKNTATSYTDTKANKGSYNFYWVFPYHYDKNGNRVIGPICGYVYGKAK